MQTFIKILTGKEGRMEGGRKGGRKNSRG
jgi:hypothetical protein